MKVRAFAIVVFALLFLRAPNVLADPLRILVAVGHRTGLAGEAPLKHAVRDATRFRDVFVDHGGVRPEHAFVLAEPSAATLMGTLERARQLSHSRRPEDVTVVFYFSGHGDREAIHLGGEKVPLREIDARLGAIQASLRIVFADACRTADVRTKGVTTEAPFAITASPGESATGVVKIHASADGEVAQESDELAGAVFTHYLVTGLAGAADVDGDSRVTLAEAYAFAYHQTLYRSTRSSGAVQRAAAVFDLKEAAPIVLTQPAHASRIGIPRSSDVRYLVFAVGSRTVVAELFGSGDRVVNVAVPAGKYIVHRRGGSRSGAAYVSLSRGEARELTAADFQSVPEETLAKKGGEIFRRHHEIGVAYGGAITRLVSLGHELGAHYAYEFDGGWALSIGGRAGTGARTANAQDADVHWLGLDGQFEYRARILSSVGVFVIRAGVGPTTEAVVQRLRRTDAERLARAGYTGERDSRALLVGGRAALGVRFFPLDAFYLGVDAIGGALGGRVQDEGAVFLGASAVASVGIAF